MPVFVAPVTADERDAAFLLTDRLRRAGIEVDTDFENKKLKAMFKNAAKRGVRLMLVLGPDEIAAGQVQIRDLVHSEDLTLPADDRLAAALSARLGEG